MQEWEQSLEDVQSYLEHTLDDYEEVPAEMIEPAGSGRILYESGVRKIKTALAAVAYIRGVVQQIPDADLMRLSEHLQERIEEWRMANRSSNTD